MTPAQLRAAADRLDAEGERAGDAGDDETALRLFALAEKRRVWADELERRGLSRPATPAKVGRVDASASASVSRAMKIARGHAARAGKHLQPAHQAILDAGLTPPEAADILSQATGRKVTRDMLKQCWASGKQRRPVKPEWVEILAKHGVPKHVWG